MRKQALDLGEAIDPLETFRMIEAEPLEAAEAAAEADVANEGEDARLILSAEVKDILKASWQTLQEG